MWLFDAIGNTLSAADELLFGPPGVCAGVIGTVFDAAIENPDKTALIVGVTLATGGLAAAAAPTIAATIGATGALGAASTGNAISSLSGAALTNASLAALCGGAVAAGGGGMGGGAAVVTGSGATISGGVSTAIAIANS